MYGDERPGNAWHKWKTPFGQVAAPYRGISNGGVLNRASQQRPYVRVNTPSFGMKAEL